MDKQFKPTPKQCGVIESYKNACDKLAEEFCQSLNIPTNYPSWWVNLGSTFVVRNGELVVSPEEMTVAISRGLSYETLLKWCEQCGNGTTKQSLVSWLTNEACVATEGVAVEAKSDVKETTNVEVEDYVDLALPSGKKWGRCNLGATNPEDAGLFFQWGDTKGYRANEVGSLDDNKKPFAYNYSDCAMRKDGEFTKYNKSDNLMRLEASDDAASVFTNGQAHMPTKDDFVELLTNTTQKLVLSDGTEINAADKFDINRSRWFEWEDFNLNGRTIKGMRIIGTNGKEIFIPASGFAGVGGVLGVGRVGYLWSASRFVYFEGYAWSLGFNSGNANLGDDGRRYGFPVRGVVEQVV